MVHSIHVNKLRAKYNKTDERAKPQEACIGMYKSNLSLFYLAMNLSVYT